MIRRRSGGSSAHARPSRHGRHGREGRSPVVRPPLGPLDTRAESFDFSVGSAAEFLRSAWEELRDVQFEVGAMPAASDDEGIPRWSIDRAAKRIVLYRLPIERLGWEQSHMRRDNELHRKMMIEGCVFRAAAEYLGRDPWDLGPERFRYF